VVSHHTVCRRIFDFRAISSKATQHYDAAYYSGLDHKRCHHGYVHGSVGLSTAVACLGLSSPSTGSLPFFVSPRWESWDHTRDDQQAAAATSCSRLTNFQHVWLSAIEPFNIQSIPELV
jgi:hypothetical protein